MYPKWNGRRDSHKRPLHALPDDDEDDDNNITLCDRTLFLILFLYILIDD